MRTLVLLWWTTLFYHLTVHTCWLVLETKQNTHIIFFNRCFLHKLSTWLKSDAHPYVCIMLCISSTQQLNMTFLAYSMCNLAVLFSPPGRAGKKPLTQNPFLALKTMPSTQLSSVSSRSSLSIGAAPPTTKATLCILCPFLMIVIIGLFCSSTRHPSSYFNKLRYF